jgi:hypothetical protein
MRATTTAAAEPRQGRAASTRWALPRRWAWPAAFTAGAVALFFAVLRLTETIRFASPKGRSEAGL